METHRRVRLRPRPRPSAAVEDALDDDVDETEEGGRISYTAVLLSQGKHRFYTLSMPSDVLAETCMVERRNEEPEVGFQRALDRKRAEEIARYIDSGFGTIPGSIVLSASLKLSWNTDGRRGPLVLIEYDVLFSFSMVSIAYMVSN